MRRLHYNIDGGAAGCVIFSIYAILYCTVVALAGVQTDEMSMMLPYVCYLFANAMQLGQVMGFFRFERNEIKSTVK